jgi:hypothetical protein
MRVLSIVFSMMLCGVLAFAGSSIVSNPDGQGVTVEADPIWAAASGSVVYTESDPIYTGSVTVASGSLGDDGDWTDNAWYLFSVTNAATYTLLDASFGVVGTAATNVDFNIEIRTAINTAGTPMYTNDQTATTTFQQFNSLSNNAVSMHEHVFLTTSAESGTVDSMPFLMRFLRSL